MKKIRAYHNTVVVTAIFVVIYFALIIASMESLWLWGLFTVAWIGAEWRFAKDSPVKTWQWPVFIVALVIVGMLVDSALF